MTRKNILITGASSGLGAGMAREFAARGPNLGLGPRRTDRLDALREELLARHPGITVAVRTLDVNDHDAVFEVFNRFAEDLGRLDRVIVNAGVGKGASLGTGHSRVTAQAAQTNFVATLAQAEAALELFRPQRDGHLVLMSSMSAVRGLPRLTTYGASKAGVAALGEGVRADLIGNPIKVTTLLPGYIRTELNATAKSTPLIIDAENGCRLLAKAIEREPARAIVPAWPWVPIGVAMRLLPLSIVAKLS